MAETTNSLLRKFINGKDFQKVCDENKDAFKELSISDNLKQLCKERGVVPEQVIKKAQIDRTYGHQIFNGTRLPSRDKLIQIAFGLGLTLEETQRLLWSSGKSGLYPRFKRDAAIIFGISHQMDIMEMQCLLTSIEIPLLGE